MMEYGLFDAGGNLVRTGSCQAAFTSMAATLPRIRDDIVRSGGFVVIRQRLPGEVLADAGCSQSLAEISARLSP